MMNPPAIFERERRLRAELTKLREDHDYLRRMAIYLIAVRAEDDSDAEEMDHRIMDLAIAAGCKNLDDAVRQVADWGRPIKSSHGGVTFSAYEVGRK